MDAQTLLNNLASVAEAPQGVMRLRDLVLNFAAAGRLVEQEIAEGTGQVVVDDGVPAVADAVARGWARERSVPEPPPDEIPFSIPGNWVWARLPWVTHGLGQRKPDREFTYLDVSSVNGHDGLLAGTPAVVSPEAAPSRARKQVIPGTVLYSTIRPYLRNIVCIDGAFDPPAIASTAFAVLHPVPGLNPRFLRICLRSRYFNQFVESRQKGVAYPAINDGDLAFGLVPVPPASEQDRIVAKVDELMALCDELEVRHGHRYRAANNFRSSALHTLIAAERPVDLRSAWERVERNWSTVTAAAESVDELHRAVIELAVAGRLTARIPIDGTADELLRAAASAGLDDPALVDSEGAAVEDPHPLPTTWRWVALGSVVSEVLAGWSAPSTQQRRARDEWAVLKVSACTWGNFRPDEHKALKPGIAPREEFEVKAGDLLITRANTADLVARSVVVDSTPPRLMLSDKTLRLTPVPGCNPRYINLANLASAARAHYRSEATGTSDSMKNVSQRAIRRAPIALPPSAEQDRIVASVDRLNRLCDDLAASLAAQAEAAEQLAVAATRSVGAR